MTTPITLATATERPGSDVSTFALDVYWAAGRSGDDTLAAHVTDCARCREYLASLDALEAKSPPLPALPSPSPAARPRWIVPMAGVLALAAGVALYVKTRAIAPAPDDYVGVKGTPAVQLLVHRARETRIWDGRSPVHPGDALALRVACEGMKRVAVAAPASGAGWARLSSAACEDGDAPLPFTLQVDDAPGDEKLAVVLSRDDLDEGALQRAIAEGKRAADVWVVSFVMPKETEKNR
jgi:hypothetical protein